jgi:hypothetical protein
MGAEQLQQTERWGSFSKPHSSHHQNCIRLAGRSETAMADQYIREHFRVEGHSTH